MAGETTNKEFIIQMPNQEFVVVNMVLYYLFFLCVSFCLFIMPSNPFNVNLNKAFISGLHNVALNQWHLWKLFGYFTVV